MTFTQGPAAAAHPATDARHLYLASRPTSNAVNEEPGLTGHHNQNADPPSPPAMLTFSDVPTDFLQLGPSESQRQIIPDNNLHVYSNNSSVTPSSSNPYHRPRKPSPGLAARLKALGFGGSSNLSSTSSLSIHEHSIGRLPEEQLRELDLKHQANSSAAEPLIERRGRAWKGAGAPLQLLRSKSSHSSLSRKEKNKAGDDETPTHIKPDLLPAITAALPLEMDTYKYRLPDHTNENSTKALPDTRRQHLRLQEKENRTPPPPPPKDTPPGGTAPSEFSPDAISYFNPLGLQRPGSIYTISRASFANQLAQLTSLQLPDAESLSSKVSAIPTAQVAAKALINAAEQIRMWIHKASEVIGGLDSDDDVEWAAAGGREGYEEVENAITRFEELINVYVSAIEELQSRNDIGNVSGDDLQKAVTQMESILEEWAKIRSTLNTAKSQVETAMEWEELWNMVLGDIQNEMDELSRLVFEMEERRHKSIMAVASGDGVDIGDLETIVEETPPTVARSNRFSMPLSPASPQTPTLSQDDSSLLALFARMQPLRASLDFLPMRLSVFEARAQQTFPTACEELEERRTMLEESYKKLQKDAESLRKELGEDKWVLVFRGAGRQAQKMYESVERSIGKLRDALDTGMHLSNPPATSKKIEGYEAKKTHYGPAIERVLSIIDKGVKERLTVNGEILRLHTEMQSKWENIKEQMRDMDLTLDGVQSDKRGQALRDSISSMLSNDRSVSGIGSGINTPGSSPPSSVIMSSLGLEPRTPATNKKNRSSSMGTSLPKPASIRSSGLAPPSQIVRKPVGSRLSTISTPSNLSTPSRSGSATPIGGTRSMPRSSSSLADNRPRWNTSVNTKDSDLGHNFKPLSRTTPSPYVKRSPTPVRSECALTPGSSKIPTLRSPLGRASSASPMPEDTPSRIGTSRMSFRDRIASPGPYAQRTFLKARQDLSSPGPYAQQTLSKPLRDLSSPGPYAQQTLAKPRLATKSSMSALNNRRVSLQPQKPAQSTEPPRSVSSMATSRRTSLLPQPKAKAGDTTGRESPFAAVGSRMRKSSTSSSGSKTKDGKPRWHF